MTGAGAPAPLQIFQLIMLVFQVNFQNVLQVWAQQILFWNKIPKVVYMRENYLLKFQVINLFFVTRIKLNYTQPQLSLKPCK